MQFTDEGQLERDRFILDFVEKLPPGTRFPWKGCEPAFKAKFEGYVSVQKEPFDAIRMWHRQAMER